MSNEDLKTPAHMLCHWADIKPDDIYLNQPTDDGLVQYSWQQVRDEVARMATYLQRYPAASHIAIMSLNCAHWVMADIAIQMAGHISIPIYPTASDQTVKGILKHAEVSAIFMGKLTDPERSIQALPAQLDKIALYKPHPNMPFWDDIITGQSAMPKPQQIKGDDLLSIIYTSGTTHEPKGVMISYQAVDADLELIKEIIVIRQSDRFVSYLPLAHVAERMAVGFAALFAGAEVFFIHSLETFTDDIKRAQPTVFFGVPRIWTKIKGSIEDKLGGATMTKVLFKIPLLNRWLKSALLKKLGFDQIRFALCAAAAVETDVLKWFDQLGLKLNEAYGMTETCGLSHMVKQSQYCFGSVGQVIPGCECRISPSGEILLRNPAMMTGYYKQKELTAKTIDSDGWLHTGDLGEIDQQGFLYLTGRCSDRFKTSKGKYISPAPIELMFQTALGIDYVLLMGDNAPQPHLLISTYDSNKQLTNDLIQECEAALDEINSKLESHERVAHIFLCDDAWTPENELLTPTLKLKRPNIEHKYQLRLSREKAKSTQTVRILQ